LDSRIYFFIGFFILLQTQLVAQEDSIVLKKYPRMGFSDLNVGGFMSAYNVSGNSRYSDSSNSAYTEKYANGISVRFQASFLDFYLKRERKKFEIADILAGEFMLGSEYSTVPEKKSKFWYAYRFDAGIGAKYKINATNDIGLNVILLKVGTDNQSTYFIGSNIGLRYRLQRIVAEAILETRIDRFLGFFWVFQSWYYNPVQLTFQAKYLMDNQRNVGFRVEYYSSQLSRHVEKVPLLENQWTLRIFYGFYF